jgi:hypothetical protein
MRYKVTIETLDGKWFVDHVTARCNAETLSIRIFNQTPNVRGVEVCPEENQ